MIDTSRLWTQEEILEYVENHSDALGNIDIPEEDNVELGRLFGIAILVEDFDYDVDTAMDYTADEVDTLVSQEIKSVMEDEDEEDLQEFLSAFKSYKTSDDDSADYYDEDDDEYDEESEILDMMHPNESHENFTEHEDY